MFDDPQVPARLPRCGEWIGALVTFPSYVTGEGEPYKPTAVMWLEPATGCVVDSQLVRPEQALPRAAGLFHLATREPLAGTPRVPARVRVSDEALAHALRGSLGDVELVVAPTPEVDDVIASLTAHIARREREDADGTTYLGPGIESGDVAHLFRAAARLYRARPWDSLPADGFVAVTCERLDITDGALCVVGQMGQSYGMSLFRSVDDATRFMEAARSGERGGLPAHFMFMFDDRRELPEPLVAEIARHGWEVAGPHAYPSFVVLDEDLIKRGLTIEEHIGITAVVTALAELVERERGLLAVWQLGARVEHETTVDTDHGEVSVTLAAPLYIGDQELGEDEEDPATWETVLDADGEVDHDLFEDHFDALMSRFEEAPEASEEAQPIAEMLVEYAASTFGATIVGLTPEEMKTLLFQVIPHKLTIEPGAAPLIVETMRGLLTFVERELGAPHAAECLAALGPNAAQRLARELADESNFGMAKTLFIQGMRAGYDMTTEEGVAAFVKSVNDERPAPKRPKATNKAKAKAKAAKAKPKAKAAPTTKAKAKATTKTAAKAKAKSKAKPKVKTKPAAKPKRTPKARRARTR